MKLKHLIPFLLGCLVALAARAVWRWFTPNSYSPLGEALGFDHVWMFFFTVVNLGLWLAMGASAISLGLYVRARPSDMMPARTLWLMSAGYVLMASGFFARVVAVWIPVYWTWLVFDSLALIVYGAAMLRFPFELRALAQRRPYRELEQIVRELERADAELRQRDEPPEVILQTLHSRVEAFVAQMSAEIARSGD